MKRPRLNRPAKSDLPILPRIFAVLAAILLVGSVALVALLPADTSLAQAVRSIDGSALDRWQHGISASFGLGFWESVMTPLLVRPVWLLPVSLGLISVGGAVSALSRASPRTKQRRS